MTSRPYPAVAAGGAAVQHKETMMDAPKKLDELTLDDIERRADSYVFTTAAGAVYLGEVISVLRADLAEARAQVAALREALQWAVNYYDQQHPMRTADYHGEECHCNRCMWDKYCSFLSDTADAAKRHDAEVRRKALEEAAQIADRQINLGEAVKAIRALIDKEPGHE